MATEYFPFDSGAGANVSEIKWSRMARLWRNDGVIPDGIYLPDNPNDLYGELVVTGSSSTLSVDVSSGGAWIQGHYFYSDATINKVLNPVSTSGNSRIDIVAVRLDWIANTITVEIVQGTEATSPTPPTLTKTFGSRWEIPLAQVTVPYGAANGAACTIVDKRVPSIAVDMVPSCEMARNADQTFTSQAAYQKLNLDQINYDNFQMADTANKDIKIRMNGLYLVKLHVRFSINVGALGVIIRNNSFSNSDILARLNNTSEGSVSWIGMLNDGDKVSGYIYNNSGQSVTVQTIGTNTPSLSVVRLGDKPA